MAVLECRWSVPDWERLIWQQFDDEYIVFDIRCSETHYLNELAVEALKHLRCNDLTVSKLACSLNQVYGDDVVSVETIAHLVAEFDRLGLIEPVLHEA